MNLFEIYNQLVLEVMTSKINHWEENISDYGNVLTTVISEDSETGDKLVLFVGFKYHPEHDLTEYSYSFMLTDKLDNPKSGFLNRRKEVAQYLPDDIKNKQLIFPIVIKLTKKLLNNMLPDKILRKTEEVLKSDKSLIRYEVIGDILTKEYGYKLLKHEVKKGIDYWTYVKFDAHEKNQDMDESYKIKSHVTREDTMKFWNEEVLPIFLADMKRKREKKLKESKNNG